MNDGPQWSNYRKEEKNPKMHMLQLIGLLEADFNTALKLIFSRKLMSNAEKIGLHEERWGCRKNRTCHDPALHKMMTFEYERYLKATIALFINDQTACFDRMYPSNTNIVAGSFGVNASTLKCRSRTIYQMKRHIKTGLGVSKEYYSNTPLEPTINGEIQGKADTGCAWTLTSSALLTAYDSLHHGIYLPDVSGDPEGGIRKANDAYVDDVDGWTASMKNGPTIGTEVMEKRDRRPTLDKLTNSSWTMHLFR